MVAALIPLRGGSKSIPDKNIKMLLGKPLCAWVLEAAVNASCIDSVYVSTDSERISKVVQSLGLDVKIIDRPSEFAQDTSSTEDVMLHFASLVEFETLCTIQATSPLLTAKQLDQAFIQFSSGRFDSMLSAVRFKRFFWDDDFQPINYDPKSRPRRQDFNGTLMENGAFYFTNRDVLSNFSCRLGGKMGVFEMDAETAVEIDEPEDWAIIEQILKKREMQ